MWGIWLVKAAPAAGSDSAPVSTSFSVSLPQLSLVSQLMYFLDFRGQIAYLLANVYWMFWGCEVLERLEAIVLFIQALIRLPNKGLYKACVGEKGTTVSSTAVKAVLSPAIRVAFFAVLCIASGRIFLPAASWWVFLIVLPPKKTSSLKLSM